MIFDCCSDLNILNYIHKPLEIICYLWYKKGNVRKILKKEKIDGNMGYFRW